MVADCIIFIIASLNGYIEMWFLFLPITIVTSKIKEMIIANKFVKSDKINNFKSIVSIISHHLTFYVKLGGNHISNILTDLILYIYFHCLSICLSNICFKFQWIRVHLHELVCSLLLGLNHLFLLPPQ